MMSSSGSRIRDMVRPTLKSLFPVQRVAKIVASRVAVIFFFFFFLVRKQ